MPDSHLIFGDFIESLRARGFTIGIGHQLRLQKLLARIGPECKPHELKTLLCPIFATDEREQTRFYEEFEKYFEYESSVEDEGETIERFDSEAAPEEERESPEKRKRIARIVGVTLFLIVLALVPLILKDNGPGPGNDVTPTPTPEISTPTPTPLTVALFQNLTIEASTLFRILLAILPFIIFAIYEIYRRFKQRQGRRESNDGVQPSIPVRFGASPTDLYDPDEVVRVARLLRARQRAGTSQLDLAASIAATIKALGFFSLREKAVSQPTEYLVLIDREAFRDHQARLFYELARKLYAESVFVTCYFFEGDPRVSFLSPFESIAAAPVVRTPEAQQKLEAEAKKAQRGATLEDLHDLHAGHRLLIFGECADLVDSVTLQTVDWIKIFAHWQDRAILTPRPPSQWDAHELALSQQFVVMPATLKGVELASESFAIREPVSIPENLRGDRSRAPQHIDSAEDLQELSKYLGEPTFQWLCACAVHPQLQWDLTLVLGAQFSTNENLFTEENLLRLFNLPWFRAGTIPDAARALLVKKLTAGSEMMVRKTIDELKARSTTLEIPLESAEVVRVPLPHEFAGPVPDQLFKRIRNIRDNAFRRFLQPQPFVLFLKRVLPEWLQRLLFTPFGLRPLARAALVLLVSGLLWAIYPVLAAAFRPSASDTNTNVNFNANVNPTPTPGLLPSPTPVPSPSVSPSIQVPSPSPRASASPTISTRPSPQISPSPRASTQPSPAPSIPTDGEIVFFDVKPSTITAGERATLSFYILRPRKVRFTPETPELTKWNTDSESLEYLRGSAVVQPKETTTYSVVATIDRSGTLKEDDRQVTLVVRGSQNTSPQPCSPSSTDIDVINTRSGSMSVSILQRCAVSSVQQSSQWVIVVNYKPIKGKSQRATYVASNGYEVRELQSIVSTRKMPSSLIDVLINDLSPIFASGDDPDTVQKKVADALRRGLGGQSGG
jgi:hypothetical protein